jgi:hypothetical protein
MRRVDQQGDVLPVRDLGNRADVADDALVSRRRDDDERRAGVRVERFSHLLRADAAGDAVSSASG